MVRLCLSLSPIPTPQYILTKKNGSLRTTACLRRAGEILSERAVNEEHDNKFGQLMRTKAVHLLALFLVVYIGVEVTIGGMIFFSSFSSPLRRCSKQKKKN